MRILYKIKLLKKHGKELYTLFDVGGNRPDSFDKYYVLSPRLLNTPHGFHTNTTGNGIYNAEHQLLGEIIEKYYTNCVVVEFYLKHEKYKQELIEFIKIKIKEMKFIGFQLLDQEDLSNDLINVEIKKRPYIPKTEKALKRWRKAFKIIQFMRDEASNSDRLEIYIPGLGDYRDRVNNELGYGYSEKTISQIRDAGDAGLLK